jgi:hypothetical protein
VNGPDLKQPVNASCRCGQVHLLNAQAFHAIRIHASVSPSAIHHQPSFTNLKKHIHQAGCISNHILRQVSTGRRNVGFGPRLCRPVLIRQGFGGQHSRAPKNCFSHPTSTLFRKWRRLSLTCPGGVA